MKLRILTYNFPGSHCFCYLVEYFIRRFLIESNIFLFRVQNLKEYIERAYGIPSLNQVLLISGGEVLQPQLRVCSYSSGTDENPIYMFSTLFDSTKYFPPWPSKENRKFNYYLYEIITIIIVFIHI